MKKSELRTGHVVTLRNGKEYVVMLNCAFETGCGDFLVNANIGSWDELDCYTEDLMCSYIEGDDGEVSYPEGDIVKVEMPYHPFAAQDTRYRKARKVLWERDKEQELEEKGKEL